MRPGSKERVHSKGRGDIYAIFPSGQGGGGGAMKHYLVKKVLYVWKKERGEFTGGDFWRGLKIF